MKTLFYPEYNKLEVTDRPAPKPETGEVLIAVAACGICGSELESFINQSKKRTPPIIMGHEFSGIITALGEGVTGWAVGDRVISNAVVSCGECRYCKAGQTNVCDKRQVFSIHRNGAFADFVNAPQSSLLAMPADLSFAEAAMTEPLANGVHMVRLTSHLACKNVLVIGAGPIGLMAQQAFQAIRGAECIVSDLNLSRLRVAADLGAVIAVDPSKEDLARVCAEFAGEEGIDIVVDAVGNNITTKQALQIVRPGGTVVLIGLQQNTEVLSSYDIITAEKQVIGSYAATQQDMADALKLIADQKVDVRSWVKYYELQDGVEAFMEMASARNIKSILINE